MTPTTSFFIMLLSAAGVIIPLIASSGPGNSPLAQCGDIDLEEEHFKGYKRNRRWQIFGSVLASIGILMQWWLPWIYPA